MKKFKTLFFIAISTLLFSCNTNVISDTDDDGIGDTSNVVNDIYELRENYDMQDNIDKYSSIRNNPKWYKGKARIRVTYSSFTKNGVTYEFQYNTPVKNNTAAVYKIKADLASPPVNVGKYVFVTLEPVPIFKKNMVILLISKKQDYTTALEAKAAAELVDIPKMEMTISHLDLVFDPTMPESDYLSYENVDANVTAIKLNYDVLEFFGTGSTYVEKQELLKKYGYTDLLN